MAAITERAAPLFIHTGEWFQQEGHICHLAGQEFIISEARHMPGPSWQQLAYSQSARQMGMRFISATAFKQGQREQFTLVIDPVYPQFEATCQTKFQE